MTFGESLIISSGKHRYLDTLTPLAGANLFIGLSLLTENMLRLDGYGIPELKVLRFGLLGLSALWSIRLLWLVLKSQSLLIRLIVGGVQLLAMAPVLFSWWWYLFEF